MTTNYMTRILVAAATAVVAAGAASAQSLKAEIPFTFRAGDKVMAAGTYRVERVSRAGSPIFAIQSLEGRAGILLMANGVDSPAKAWSEAGRPLLSFDCGEGRCTLTSLWTGSAAPVYALPHPKLRDEHSHMATIVMHTDKGE